MSYVLGSVSFALFLGKLLRGVDIRDHGSGNVGASNAGRVLGRPIGVTVLVLDVAKGFVPAFLFARLVASSGSQADGGFVEALWMRPGLLFGVAAILGHSFPFYLKFKGGKAVATSAGVLLALAWVETLIVALVWVIVIKLTRMISVASMASALAFPLVCLGFKWSSLREGRDFDVLLIGVLLAALVLFRHRSNVGRILAGTEPRVGAKS